MTTSTFFERWLVRACFYAGWAAAVRAQGGSDGPDEECDDACQRFLDGKAFAEAVRHAGDHTLVTESDP